MIQPLRRRHRWVWFLLAVILPSVFVAGLLVRRPTTPVNDTLHWEHYK